MGFRYTGALINYMYMLYKPNWVSFILDQLNVKSIKAQKCIHTCTEMYIYIAIPFTFQM